MSDLEKTLRRGRRILSVLPILAIVAVYCDSSERSRSEQCFAIYTLANPSVDVTDASRTPLEALVLSPQPFLDRSDIKSYRWKDHTISLTPEAYEKIRALGQSVQTKPFVVMVGSERIYLGGFWAVYSSLGRFLPHISFPLVDGNSISIAQPWRDVRDQDDPGNDMRSDERIYKCLVSEGVLSKE